MCPQLYMNYKLSVQPRTSKAHRDFMHHHILTRFPDIVLSVFFLFSSKSVAHLPWRMLTYKALVCAMGTHADRATCE